MHFKFAHHFSALTLKPSQKKPRPSATFATLILWISQRAVSQRKAATANTAIKLIIHSYRQGDLFFQSRFPRAADVFPVAFSGYSIFGQVLEGELYFFQRETKPLSYLNQGENSKFSPRKQSMVTATSSASKQPFRFIKVYCRYCHPASTGKLSNRQKDFCINCANHAEHYLLKFT